MPAWLSYHMISDQDWNVQAARLRGIVAGKTVDLSIRRRFDGLWGMNGRGLPDSEAAADLELSITPACRLFTLRRAMTRAETEVDLQTVRLHKTHWGLEPVTRKLRRMDPDHWQLTGPSGTALPMTVDEYGFPVDCDDIWCRQVIG